MKALLLTLSFLSSMSAFAQSPLKTGTYIGRDGSGNFCSVTLWGTAREYAEGMTNYSADETFSIDLRYGIEKGEVRGGVECDQTVLRARVRQDGTISSFTYQARSCGEGARSAVKTCSKTRLMTSKTGLFDLN